MKADPRSKRRHAIAALIALAALMASCDNILETIPRKDTGGGTGGGGTLTAVARLAGSSARHALPSLPALAYGALLYHDASSQGDFSSGIVSADGASVAFAFQTPSERSGLTLEVFAFADGTERADFSREGALLCGKKGDVEIQDNKITAEVALLPNKDASAKGTASLKVKVPPDCALEIDDTANFAFTADSPDAERTYTVTQKDAGGIMGGAYALTFTVKKGGGVVHVFSEHINVFPGMVTDTWSGLSQGEAREVTQAMLSTTVYVRGAGGWYDGSADFKDTAAASDDNPGSLMRPFATIQKAVDTIIARNDRSSAYTILVDGTLDGKTAPLLGEKGMADISPTKALNLKIQSMSETTPAMLDAQNNGRVLNINANAAVTLKNVNITGGYDNMGGGIYNDGTLTVSGGTISGCYADYGGGIYNGTGGVLSVNGCTISGCTAKNTGGGIYITTNTSAEIANCTVESCRTEAEANANNKGGAGIYTFGGTADKPVTITNCTILGINDGTVDATYGGGINNGGVLIVSGGTISGFTAKYSGGGVYSTGTLTMEGGTVTNNTAKEYGGGAICISGSTATAAVDGTTISKCTTATSCNGGAISVNGGTLRMTGGTITGCTATQYGGGISISGSSSSAAITNCTIGGSGDDKCSATRAGAIYVGSGTLTLTGGTVSGNTATTYGGGIYNYGTLTVTGGTIENCTANAAGAIYNVGTLTVSGGSVTNCTAATSGGGIYNDVTDASAVTKIENCEISGCKALGTDGANGGGGIYNNAGTLELTNCTITGGGDTGTPDARYGGGINVHSGSTLTMTGSEITNCTATLGGGVFYNGGASDMTGCTVSGNKATGKGGGIYLCGGKTFTMKGGTISGNEAATNGGGMFVGGVTFVIEYGEITGNSATTNGGGVHIDSGSTLTVKDGAKISKNNAKFGGGVSFLGGTFIMSGGTISENGASSRGGGIYRGGGTFTMGGSASVPAGDDGKNDVYLASGKTIGIASTLTAESPVATITPNAYTEGTAVLELASGSATTLADECEKFAVTAESDGTEWLVAEDGTLKSSVPEGFVRVNGGTVTGGALTPASDVFVSGRTVTIPDMYVCDHEVTQKEYEAYCTYGSSSPSSTYGVGDNYPAYYVNWYDAIVYCNLRSIAEGLTPAYKMGTETDPKNWSGTVESGGKYRGPSSTDTAWDAITYNENADGYRLPTEAEWEYIARGGKTSGTTYSGSDTIDGVAWYSGNSGYKSHEVKQKVANALGLYDMSGNVWEWCWDRYGSISGTTAPTGSASGSYRVYRGGSWNYGANICAVSYRNDNSPNSRDSIVGFRVVRSVSQ